MTLALGKMLQTIDEEIRFLCCILNFKLKMESDKYEFNFMATKSFFQKCKNWLQNTEMFERPRKKLAGRWQLFEYYIDAGEELLHFEERELTLSKDVMTLEIHDEGKYANVSTLSIEAIQRLQGGEWSTSKNYITFLDPENFRNHVEFQYAFEKGNLKLLRKDTFGKIEFFGFFKPLDV
jgi:hypothetical protein